MPGGLCLTVAERWLLPQPARTAMPTETRSIVTRNTAEVSGEREKVSRPARRPGPASSPPVSGIAQLVRVTPRSALCGLLHDDQTRKADRRRVLPEPPGCPAV